MTALVKTLIPAAAVTYGMTLMSLTHHVQVPCQHAMPKKADALQFLDDGGKFAIFDATNSTSEDVSLHGFPWMCLANRGFIAKPQGTVARRKSIADQVASFLCTLRA